MSGGQEDLEWGTSAEIRYINWRKRHPPLNDFGIELPPPKPKQPSIYDPD